MGKAEEATLQFVLGMQTHGRAVLAKALSSMSCRLDGKLAEVSEEHSANAACLMLVTEVAERSIDVMAEESKALSSMSCRLDGKLNEVSEEHL